MRGSRHRRWRGPCFPGKTNPGRLSRCLELVEHHANDGIGRGGRRKLVGFWEQEALERIGFPHLPGSRNPQRTRLHLMPQPKKSAALIDPLVADSTAAAISEKLIAFGNGERISAQIARSDGLYNRSTVMPAEKLYIPAWNF